MLFTIIVVVLFVVLDIAAMLWGTNSREYMSGLEWNRSEHQGPLFAKQET